MTAVRPAHPVASVPRARAGFTLVELLVVVGVIVILLGITVAVIPLVNAQAKARETRATMDVLAAALQEWEVNAERTITWYEDGLPMAGMRYDMQREMPDALTISEVVEVIRRSPSSRSMITNLPASAVHEYVEGAPAPLWITNPDVDDPDPLAGDAQNIFDGEQLDGQIALLDAWGTPIRVIHPGLEWSPVLEGEYPFADDDGTVRTGPENRYGVCVDRNMAFVSAGPDGKFGVADPANGLFEYSTDNLYSYVLGDLP